MRIPFALVVCLVIGSFCSTPSSAFKNAGWNRTPENRAELAGSVTTSGPPIEGAVHSIAATGSGIADLTIAVTASPDPVPSHWPIVYTIEVTNLGPDVATSVTVTEPDQLFPGVGAGNLTLNPGESKMLFVARTVTAQPGSTQVLTATARGDQADPNSDNNTTTISTPIVQAVPVIEFVSVDGKNLNVTGFGFDEGAIIVLNGEDRRTVDGNPIVLQELIGKKAAKKIAPGQTVRVQVRDANGNVSGESLFTRPGV